MTRHDDDRGSAVVEFVLVGVLVIVLFLALVQVGLALHVRNTLVAATAEGARFGANGDRTPEDGAQHARDLIRQTLPPSYADDVTARVVDVAGFAVVEVDVRAALPVFGWLGPAHTLTVHGHALDEG